MLEAARRVNALSPRTRICMNRSNIRLFVALHKQPGADTSGDRSSYLRRRIKKKQLAVNIFGGLISCFEADVCAFVCVCVCVCAILAADYLRIQSAHCVET